MTSMLLEAGTNSVWSYVLIGVVALLLIAMPIMMNAKNKKETQKVQEQTNSLKVGDKILTTSGVYGTITELKFDDSQKVVVIETGGKVKSYMSVDAYAIYTVFKSDAELAKEAEAKAEAEKKAAEEAEAKKVEKSEKKTSEKKSTKKKAEKKEPVETSEKVEVVENKEEK